MQPYGLVFAGGGARGSYQMGVWKAIDELKIPIITVVGTSIGALNGALFAQNDFDSALQAWGNISLKDVVRTKGELFDTDNLFASKNIISIAKEIISYNGLDTTPLKELLLKNIDEAKVRNSDIDFGLVTYSLTDHQPIELFISSIPDGMLIDYLLASCCFPGFKPAEIDNSKFVDGGVANNMPVSMLVEKGIKDIIAVDLGGYSFVKGIHGEDLNIKIISHESGLGGFFEFNRNILNRNMNYGYLDTLKAFGSLYGSWYYFRASDMEKLIRNYSQKVIRGLEQAAKIYGIANDKIFSADEFINTLMNAHSNAVQLYKEARKKLNKSTIIESFQQGTIKLEDIITLPLICEITADRWLGAGTNRFIRRFFPKEYLAVSALYVMERHTINPHIM